MYSYINFGMPFRFVLFYTIPTSSFSTSYLIPNSTFTISTSFWISYVTIFISTSFQIPLVKGLTFNPFFKIMVATIRSFKKICNSSSKFYDRDDMFGKIINFKYSTSSKLAFITNVQYHEMSIKCM